MSNEPNIYWLASYPKSGNTWARAFIANLLSEEPEAVDINALRTGAIASDREWVEMALEFDTDELSDEESDALRPAAYRWLSQRLDSPGHHKIHDAYTFLSNGEPLIPVDATRGALCIIRNPLDVAISYAYHEGCGIDFAIELMASSKHNLCGNHGQSYSQLRQQLLSWSEHVTSWVDAPNIDKYIVRYEDMKQSPLETFTRIALFLGVSKDEKSILAALEHCSMENLQAQESLSPFKEKVPHAKKFFRKGIVGDWQTTLSATQIEKIICDHRNVMQRFGYLDIDCRPSELITAKETACVS
jgi:hypothetical protein